MVENRDFQVMIDWNTRNLLYLQAVLFEEYIFNISFNIMRPQQVEGHPWGTVWLYRTALTKGRRPHRRPT